MTEERKLIKHIGLICREHSGVRQSHGFDKIEALVAEYERSHREPSQSPERRHMGFEQESSAAVVMASLVRAGYDVHISHDNLGPVVVTYWRAGQ